jgi:excisionase family DNA binding protein
VYVAELSVSEAADRLGVTQARVRSLLASGRLVGRRAGSLWLVDSDAVAQRVETVATAKGRPFSTRIAWTAAALLDGQETTWLSTSERSRLRTRLRQQDAQTYRWWMQARASTTRYRIADTDIAELFTTPGVVLGGISAASHYGLGLGHGNEAEIYTDAADRLVDEFFLVASARGNLVLHSDITGWHHKTAHPADGVSVAPRLVVAADLLDSDDTRSRSAGERLLKQVLHSETSRSAPGAS